MFGYNVRFAFRVISDRKYGLLSEYSIHNVKKKGNLFDCIKCYYTKNKNCPAKFVCN